jgi:hypothetical protein
MKCSLWGINLVAKNKKGYSIKVLMKQSGIQTLPCFHKLFYAKSKGIHQIYQAIHLQFSNEFFRSLLCDDMAPHRKAPQILVIKPISG